MPRNNMPGFVSTNDTAVQRMNPGRHDFSGANVWGIRALAYMRNDVMSGDFYDPDAVPFYENAARRAETMVRSAATLELRESPREAAPGDRVNILVRVTNTSGHRLPTGYTDGRRMWLEVALIDADRRETVVSGAYNMTEAQLDTSDTQIKVYEALHGRAGMGFEEHIALHDTILKDNRIPPRGYRPLPGHEPVGADYSGGEGGTLRHWDDTRYNFTIPTGARGPVTVRARLRYQTTTRQYVEFLNHENHTDDRGRTLQRIWEATGRAAPVDMAQATSDITLVAPRPDASVSDASTDAAVADGSMDAGIMINTAEGGCQCHAGRAPSTRGNGALLLAALGGLVLRTRRRAKR